MSYKRICLKLSGEALAGESGKGFSESEVTKVMAEVKKVVDMGIQVGIVIGGGNFWRGRSSGDMDRVKADQIGMLATVMNCVYAADELRQQGVKCHVMTPYQIGDVTELYVRDKAVEYHNKYYSEKYANSDHYELHGVYIDITGQKHIKKRPEMI